MVLAYARVSTPSNFKQGQRRAIEGELLSTHQKCKSSEAGKFNQAVALTPDLAGKPSWVAH